MPDVYYDGLQAGTGGSISLSAHGSSYETVAQQLLLLESDQAQEFATEVSITGAQLAESADGGQEVNFAIQLTLNPDLYYYAQEK